MSEESYTEKWLRELGAVRPMSPAADEVLCLGKWFDGYYPIEWFRIRNHSTDIYGNRTEDWFIERWRIFGINVQVDVTRSQCERILQQLKDEQ